MDCKQFEKQIPEFLGNRMDYETMEDFRKHMEICPACREELSIQFLVAEGMRHLEEDGAFDLQKELDRRLAENNRRLYRHVRFLSFRRYALTALAIAAGMFLIVRFG